MKLEQTECFKASAYKIQTPGNYPEDNIQHSEHGESFNSRKQQIFAEQGTSWEADNLKSTTNCAVIFKAF
jgi:hypothetical protein